MSYAVVGELARAMRDPRQQMLFSRSARDLIALCSAHPDLHHELVRTRPLLRHVGADLEVLEAAIDRERRELMHRNEQRLAAYELAASSWAARWPALAPELKQGDLQSAHRRMVEQALLCLPFAPGGAS